MSQPFISEFRPYHTSPRMPYAILLFGPHGVGKDKLGDRLARDNPEFVHISIGKLIRSLQNNSGDLGEKIRECYENDSLLPDGFVRDIFQDYLAHLQINKLVNADNQILLLNGIPRTKSQVEMLDELVNVTGVLRLEAPIQVLLERGQRRINKIERCKYGEFDRVISRLERYYTTTHALLTHYPDSMIHRINTDQPKEDTYFKALNAIMALAPSKSILA